ncbi:MAG: septum formation initiator family protein [Bacteroidales bacterium]|nr:septum formation initiator family protein [Bacteroidales bacterium]
MKPFFRWCRRYISAMSILVIAFVVYTLFVQDNSIFRYVEYSRTIDSLNVEIKHATDTMIYYRHLNSLLSTDPELMEKVVRERYNMVRDGEDVYVFD